MGARGVAGSGRRDAEILPVAERYGMGVLVWSPLAQGLLTGRVRKGQATDLRRTRMFQHMRDERRLDAVEQIIPVAEQAGLKLTHMAVAFAISHPPSGPMNWAVVMTGPITRGQTWRRPSDSK